MTENNRLAEMASGIPASLITVGFAETMHKVAGQAYQQANRDLQRYALLASALLIRERYPTATHLIVTPSDQGPYLTPEVIVDPECGLDDNEIEEYDDIQDQLWSWINDLDEDDPWGLWQPFVTSDDPTGRAFCWALDLDLILFHYGDAASVMKEYA